MTASLYERIEARRAAADVDPLPDPAEPDPDAVVRLVAQALESADDPVGALRAWDSAGSLHDLSTLDVALPALAPGGGLLGGLRRPRRRLRESARHALRTTQLPGTLALAVAVLGAYGAADDVPALETVSRHPVITLHGVTALANLGLSYAAARAALLRLLSVTQGQARVAVIDRLLAFTAVPLVRLALVRDSLTGLEPEAARQVAGDLAQIFEVERIVDDPDAPADLRAGARLVARHAREAAADDGS